MKIQMIFAINVISIDSGAYLGMFPGVPKPLSISTLKACKRNTGLSYIGRTLQLNRKLTMITQSGSRENKCIAKYLEIKRLRYSNRAVNSDVM